MKMSGAYANGQIMSKISKGVRSFFYKNGVISGKGRFIKNKIEGKWKFYRETGTLWGIGNFKSNLKHGRWVRYNRNNKIEYDAEFIHGKEQKEKSTK